MGTPSILTVTPSNPQAGEFSGSGEQLVQNNSLLGMGDILSMGLPGRCGRGPMARAVSEYIQSERWSFLEIQFGIRTETLIRFAFLRQETFYGTHNFSLTLPVCSFKGSFQC